MLGEPSQTPRPAAVTPQISVCLMEVKVRKWNLVAYIDLMNNTNPFVFFYSLLSLGNEMK